MNIEFYKDFNFIMFKIQKKKIHKKNKFLFLTGKKIFFLEFWKKTATNGTKLLNKYCFYFLIYIFFN
jgi:murein L,D-transpeptidase YafK